ncbi:MAG: hypothetical protein M3162_04305 [Thermoproteota archaeon]|nr:hypothetical protein [Thermoproteota archaeon]
MIECEIKFLSTKLGKKVYKDFTLSMRMGLSLDSFLKWLEIRMKRSFSEINRHGIPEERDLMGISMSQNAITT